MSFSRWPGLLLGAGLALAAPTVQARGYDAAAWQRDYVQLKRLMEREYANLAWFASPEGGLDLPRLDRQTRRMLRAARNEGEARRALEAFVAAFKDGHFAVLGDEAEAHATAAQAVPTRPVDASDIAGSCAAQGFLPTARVAFSLPLESLPNFRLTSDGLSTVYRVGIATAVGGGIGFIRIQNFTMRAFPAACTLALQDLKAKGAAVDGKALRASAQTRWLSAFADEIAALKAAGMSALVIDVGNNSGGDDSGDLFARLLTGRPVHSARLRMAATGAARDYADEQLEGIAAALAASSSPDAQAMLAQAREFFTQAKAQAEQPCDMSWVWTQRRPWSGSGCKRLVDVGYAGGYAASLPRGSFGDRTVASRLSYPSSADDLWGLWTGPLYVLTDGRTHSSAEMFAAVVQDNHVGKTAGAMTGGDGCGFMGGMRPRMLAHSSLRLRMPDCLRLRADGRDEVAGVAPNLPVQPTAGEDARQRAERLIEAVAADQAAR